MEPIWSLGLMSGTSLDGIDAALVRTDGVEIAEFGASRFRPYSNDETQTLRDGLGAMPGPGLEAVAEVVLTAHAEAAAGLKAELIGFHGQTLSHDPARFHTFQIGDGSALAALLGAPVVWDFRTADVLSGGEGAPLVPVFHFAAARHAGLTGTLAILNIGGVANVTWVNADASAAEDAGALLAFDTGPGNALINDFLRLRRGAQLDAGGELAAEGTADEDVIAQVLTHPYFSRLPAKSLDRDDFAHVQELVASHTDADGAATLTALTAATIAASLRHMPLPPDRWLITGGGRHNHTLMRMIGQRTNAPVDPVEAVGLDGDMLEAQAFAYLAARVKRGLATSLPSTTGARLPVCGGRISDPDSRKS
ncbi:anhydro-N-acetylmuramic acid kinase [Algicella marina]|uniref:Anhydro-N-acetylmuramic acid kinase n=1 Tax=Algicella marina TaxID=2683284 RepID=A0A6P1T4P9_9RHOB|nr:anhydro-N-acetylmuramic acid kinase [Algicella marina]QHQ36751.1 anhydro-N-acetylmuramic acid kinase [Algicella marina]